MSSTQQSSQAKNLPDKLTRRKRIFRSFEAKALSNRSTLEKISDSITNFSGTIPFLIAHIVWFTVWIGMNIHRIKGVPAFDPFPFGLLTMIVSLEAIVLSVFVLLSQNRAAKIDTLRAELNLQVNLIAEEEITKTLEMLASIQKKLGILEEDIELDRMLNRIDTSYIERALQKQLENGQGNIMNIINSNVKQKEEELKQEIKSELSKELKKDNAEKKKD
jgi:uncharacterized membrane protein